MHCLDVSRSLLTISLNSNLAKCSVPSAEFDNDGGDIVHHWRQLLPAAPRELADGVGRVEGAPVAALGHVVLHHLHSLRDGNEASKGGEREGKERLDQLHVGDIACTAQYPHLVVIDNVPHAVRGDDHELVELVHDVLERLGLCRERGERAGMVQGERVRMGEGDSSGKGVWGVGRQEVN